MSSASNWWSISPMSSGGNIITTSTTSTAAEALTYSGGRYKFTALTSNAYVRFGTSTVGVAAATDTNFDDVIPAGSSVVYTVPPSVTHFRVIADAAGTLVVSKVGN